MADYLNLAPYSVMLCTHDLPNVIVIEIISFHADINVYKQRIWKHV